MTGNIIDEYIDVDSIAGRHMTILSDNDDDGDDDDNDNDDHNVGRLYDNPL